MQETWRCGECEIIPSANIYVFPALFQHLGPRFAHGRGVWHSQEAGFPVTDY